MLSKFKSKKAFTLAEIIIALVIVGVLAIIVIPGLIKDINNKTKMGMLRSVVSKFNSAVEGEFIKSRTQSIYSTNVYLYPQTFLNTLDNVPNPNKIFGDSYRNYVGSTVDVTIPNVKTKLKNGASIGLEKNLYGQNDIGIIIDVNGDEEPNMVGVDYYILELSLKNENAVNKNAGEIGGYVNGGAQGTETHDGLKTSCHNGNGASCYRLAELSGFDPNYIDK